MLAAIGQGNCKIIFPQQIELKDRRPAAPPTLDGPFEDAPCLVQVVAGAE